MFITFYEYPMFFILSFVGVFFDGMNSDSFYLLAYTLKQSNDCP